MQTIIHDPKDYCRLIRTLMAEQDLIALDIWDRTGLSEQTVSAHRNGADPRLSNVIAMLGALGYNIVIMPQD